MDIHALRKSAKMSKKEFCKYFGIPACTLDAWASGQEACPEYLINLMAYKLEKEGLAIVPIDLGESNSLRRMADEIIL